ncbi:MAG: tyrosine-type recombinase/integrase [Microlunatus sp.]|nr:tyrosine-type recombinase/integrase [Microlunatus sp.]
MGEDRAVALAVFDASVGPLRPEDAGFEGMLRGWRAQGQARGLAATSLKNRGGLVRRFVSFSGDYPWSWTAEDLESWSSDLRDAGRVLTTIRGYQATLRLFCEYVTDPAYGWGELCWERFGTHPVQICHEWNTVAHVSEVEASPAVRPLTRDEIERLFDYADERVAAAGGSGRKGWLAAWRDSAMFKVCYAYGLRRRELAKLETVDFYRNPKAPEFDRFGVCHVRWGKAVRGGHPRRRSVLTTMSWAPQVLGEWLEVRAEYGDAAGRWMWPTERGAVVSPAHAGRRFAEYRDAAGLPSELHLHCLRHSYVTHLLEDGFDPFFVQQQVGHRWGGSTALYSGVSSDFKNKALRATLDQLTGDAREGS